MITTTPARALLALPLLLAGCRGGTSTTSTAAPPATPAPVTQPGDPPLLPARVTPTFAPGWRFTPGGTAVSAPRAMVVSNSRDASRAGDEILRAGGNAVDAAVAVGFALAVTYPFAGNLGGGGFMVIRLADGRVASIDYREVAPLAATRNMFIDSTGKLTDRSVVGHLASGVPGAVAGMAEALGKYGTKSLAEVLAPAIRLAEEGFMVDSTLMRQLNGNRSHVARFAGAEVFYPNGQPLQPGTVFRQPVLARTLRAIAKDGVNAFYRGWVADSLVAEMKRGGGIITKEDLARYRPLWREPIRSTYRGFGLITMPPASSGGITMSESLNILEGFGPLPPFGTAAYTHRVAEAFRRAFVDRNAKLADPAFVKVPVDTLTSKEYAARLRATIDTARASKTPAFEAGREPSHTTHYSVVDAEGNAVSTTTTINGGFGSGVYIPGTGFLMNNEMDDFAAQPGKPNMFGLVQGERNAVQPGKRMLSAMSPTIVLDPQGKVLLVVGAAGGPTIITSVTQVILNVVEHRMTLADAMVAPRVHHQALPDQIRVEMNGLAPDVIARLEAMGHTVVQLPAIANVNAIMRVGGGWHGVVEPRGVGGAVGH